MDAERTALLSARLAGLIPEATAEAQLARLDARTLELEHVLSDVPDEPPGSGRKTT
ncbi:hypothetical protein ACN28S_52560 [Cystobacter fuscus]